MTPEELSFEVWVFEQWELKEVKEALRQADCGRLVPHATVKMKEGPSESLCRERLQTAISCFSQKLRW